MVDGACRRKGALFSHFMDGRAWRPAPVTSYTIRLCLVFCSSLVGVGSSAVSVHSRPVCGISGQIKRNSCCECRHQTPRCLVKTDAASVASKPPGDTTVPTHRRRGLRLALAAPPQVVVCHSQSIRRSRRMLSIMDAPPGLPVRHAASAHSRHATGNLTPALPAVVLRHRRAMRPPCPSHFLKPLPGLFPIKPAAIPIAHAPCHVPIRPYH